MYTRIKIMAATCLLVLSTSTTGAPQDTLKVMHTARAPLIDGKVDMVWQQATWQNINHHILGDMPSAQDFSGRYKLLWDQNKLYLLAEITDDILVDSHPNPLNAYWDDDCLEVFIDEDASGGDHQFNFNAFAYHIALDNQVVDIGYQLPDGTPDFILLNDHVQSRWQRSADAPHTLFWELAISIYDDSFTYSNTNASTEKPPIKQAKAVTLSANKNLGFMLAYCDNDGSKTREHFIGSHAITAVNGDKNLGYKNASVFGKLILADPKQ